MSSSDDWLDPSKPSGAVFSFAEEHPTQFYKLNQSASTPSVDFDQGEISIINDESTEFVGHEASILAVPIANDETYTL